MLCAEVHAVSVTLIDNFLVRFQSASSIKPVLVELCGLLASGQALGRATPKVAGLTPGRFAFM